MSGAAHVAAVVHSQFCCCTWLPLKATLGCYGSPVACVIESAPIVVRPFLCDEWA